MALYIVLKSGPSQGQTFAVSHGLTIGRKGAGIRLDDAKVSSEHARVVATPENGFQLEDLQSKNGIHQNGVQVGYVLLVPGVEFEVGHTKFSVFDGDAPVPAPEKEKKARKKWNEVISSFLRKSLFQFENEPREMVPLHPALVLDFLRGAQADTRWVMGYGPRKVGRLSLDFPIFEKKASPICFEVSPSAEGVVLKAVGPEVRLNDKKFSSEVLRVGDRIQILDTEIEVDFANEHD